MDLGLKEKILGEFEVTVNVEWGKPIDIWDGEEYVKRQALDYPEGFLARLLISETRIFIITEFTDEFKMGILTPIIPGIEKKIPSLYMELAIDKVEKYSFGLVKNEIMFSPHGQLGRTTIEFRKLPAKFKKEIPKILEKARALKLKAKDAGILFSDRPIKEVYEERMSVINAQRLETPTPETGAEPESEEITIPTAKSQTIRKMETVPSEETKISELPEPAPEIQEEEKVQSEEIEIEITEPPVPIEEIELAHSESEELKAEEANRLEKTWKSLVPRETICPYCKKRVLTIDRVCPDCGAINL